MKQSVNFSQFVDAFREFDRFDQFGYDALRVLFDYFEQYENDTGEQIELDVIAICCEYTAQHCNDVAYDYGIDIADIDDEDEQNQKVIDYVSEHSVFIGEYEGGIVYATF